MADNDNFNDQDEYESSEEESKEETTCPLCVEEMDLSDKNFLPCPCGYRVCMWCWHHIRENLNGLCPACRTPYNADPHAFSAVNTEEIVKKNKERKIKEKQDKKLDVVVGKNTPSGGVVKSNSSQAIDRRLLHNYRVVQRNLVYVIGIPGTAGTEDILRKPEYFGQYGKIVKIVIHKNHNVNHANTISAYATFAYKEDARAAIQALEGFWLDNHLLRASFGTTKYCNNFIRGVPCNNPECVYLHELGDDDDRFTKEEIQQQAGHSKPPPVAGKDQALITGNGGPSGTGKRPTGETVFPQPVFIQELNVPVPKSSATATVSVSAGMLASVRQNSSGALNAIKASASPENATPVADDSSLNAAKTDDITSLPPSKGATVANPIISGVPHIPPAAAAATTAAAQNSYGIKGSSNPTSSTNIYSNESPTPPEVWGYDSKLSGGGGGTSRDVRAVIGNQGGSFQDLKNMYSSSTSAPPSSGADAKPVMSTVPVPNMSNEPPPYRANPNNRPDDLPLRPHLINSQESSSHVEDPNSADIGQINSNINSQQIQGVNRRSEATQQLVTAASFNGIGKCAVFPVPISSLAISVWATILEVSSSDLSVNPFNLISLPISEILELTLPPVDASSISPWPKPLQHYTQGNLGSAVNNTSFQSQTMQTKNMHYPGNEQELNNIPDNISRQMHSHSQQSSQVNRPQFQQPLSQTAIQSQPISQIPQHGIPSAIQSGPLPSGNGNLGVGSMSGNGNIAALKQMFPTVNMAYGAPNKSAGNNALSSNIPPLKQNNIQNLQLGMNGR